MNRIDAHFVAAGKYHDIDFARLEVLKLLGEHQNIRTTVAMDFSNVERIAACKFLITYTCAMKEETLNDRDIQFPRPDDRFMTRKTRHSFANINLNSRDGRVEGMDAVLRFDTVSGKEDVWHFGNGASAGELVFAPRVGSTDEADGYAMTIVHPANSGTSELAIFRALDLAAGPIASVQIPFRVPSGFHCNYYSADSALYTQAIPQQELAP